MVSDSLVKIRAHLQSYWARCQDAYDRNDYPMAAFLAITLIEEVGKVFILGNAELGKELDKKTFRNHRGKYRHAVGGALFVNSRVSRIYVEEEKRFAEWFRKDKLFIIRNNALYAEITNEHLTVPSETIKHEDARLLVCIAGEILAEAQGEYIGTGPDEWKKLLKQVDDFRDRTLPGS